MSHFHPDAPRFALLASGGKHGFAQSLFQVGGNAGSSLGPLLAALVVVRGGQGRIAWLTVLPLLGFGLLMRVGTWYRDHLAERSRSATAPASPASPVSRDQIVRAVAILVVLIFSKYFY